MKNFQVAFDVKDQGEVALVGYQEIGYNPIFDIQATTLTWKVRFFCMQAYYVHTFCYAVFIGGIA